MTRMESANPNVCANPECDATVSTQSRSSYSVHGTAGGQLNDMRQERAVCPECGAALARASGGSWQLADEPAGEA